MTEIGDFGYVTVEAAAVLFDMDGTLVDSTEVVERLWGEFADGHGVDLHELLGYAHGRRSRDVIGHFLPDGADVDAVATAMEAREPGETDGIVEIPGARRLLEQLPDSRLAVVTSAPRVLAEVRLTAAGVRIPSVLVPADEVKVGKPDPEGYLAAARRLGVSATDCLVVEDAEAGLRAAVASGAQVLVVGGHSSETTQGLFRVPDFTGVEVLPADTGIRLRWKV